MRKRPLAVLLCAGLMAFMPMTVSFTASAATADSASTTQQPQDKSVVTEHRLKLHGDTIKYTATTGNMVIRDQHNQPDASVFYIAYTVKPERGETRPVTFLFNGGPGSSSLWLHMGSFGPVRVLTTNADATPPAPYVYKDNAYSLLDKTDLVFIDAFGTGFSRGLAAPVAASEKAANDDEPNKKFWGVDGDVDGFARFIKRYVTVNQRWNSPKFVIGESYGTIRAPALVNVLQNDGMAFNGVVLVSSILNYAARSPGLDRQYVGLLPTYAAVAYYHDKLPQKPAELEPFLDKVRQFAETDYAQALAAGQSLSAAQRDKIAQQMQQYTGLSSTYLKRANLRVNQAQFRKELLRDQERMLGRYDGRFVGIDMNDIGEYPDTDPSDTAISAAFVAAFQDYLAKSLNYKNDDEYRVFSMDANRYWDWSHNVPGAGGWPVRMPYVVRDLGDAIRTNPGLQVFSANGYFDMATPFHSTEYDLNHMQLDPSLLGNVHMGYYRSGHMIYLNEKALVKLHHDLEAFYDQALPPLT